MKIENSVAFISGANRGIGLAFAKALLSRGAAKVYAAARNAEQLTVVGALAPSRIVPVPLDVTNKESVRRAAEQAGDTNLLINNAGVAFFSSIMTEDEEKARIEMETNYFGVLSMARMFAPILKANNGGVMVNMNSIASHVNFPVLGSYSASKAASHSLTQGLRAELLGQGTKVLGVYPGPVDTDMAKPMPMEKASPDEVANLVLDAVEAEQEDVYPDTMSADLHAGLLGDPKAVEKTVGAMLPE